MYAFFDVDGTLLDLRSMTRFQDFYLRREGPGPRALGAARSGLFFTRFACWQLLGKDRNFLNRAYYRSYRGRSPDVIRARAEEWFAFEKQRRNDLLIAPAVRALEAHRARGDVPVFVSGSLTELLEPLARELGVMHCLATRLQVRDGRYTGEIEGPQMIGEGKATAIRAFLTEHGADASACFAYGDHSSDVPMLEAVGHPVAVAGDRRLAEHARQRGWAILLPRAA